MEKEEAGKFTLNTFALSKMGHIGLVLLLLSGVYPIIPFISTLSARPLLIAKLMLVVVLIILILLLDSAAKKAQKGDLLNQLKKIQTREKFHLLPH